MEKDTVVTTTVGELDDMKKDLRQVAKDEALREYKGIGAPLIQVDKSKRKGHDLDTTKGQALTFMRCIRAIASGNGNYDSAKHIVKGWLSESKFEHDEIVLKVLGNGALSPSALNDGGLFITPETYGEFIELLRAKSVFRTIQGITYLKSKSGVVELNKELGIGTSSTWVGEIQSPAITKPKFGQDKMTLKTLATLLVIPNAFLRRADSGSDQQVFDIVQKDMSNKLDAAYIRSMGGAHTPMGLRGLVPSGNKFDSGGTTTAQVKTDLTKLISKLQNNNVDTSKLTYLMSDRSQLFIGDVSSTNDILIFESILQEPPKLKGKNVLVTNNIPNNLNTDKSEIYAVAGDQLIIADGLEMNVTSSDSTGYTDEDGNKIDSFVAGQTVFKFENETDLYVKHVEAISLMEAVAYGA